MKNITFAILILLLPILGIKAQSRIVKDFENHYFDEDEVTSVTINGTLIQFAGWVASLSEDDDPELEAFRKLSKNIERIHILNIDDWERLMKESTIKRLENDLYDDEYELLLTAREKGSVVKILSKFGKKDRIEDAVMLAWEDDDFSIISMEGSFNLKDIEGVIDIH